MPFDPNKLAAAKQSSGGGFDPAKLAAAKSQPASATENTINAAITGPLGLFFPKQAQRVGRAFLGVPQKEPQTTTESLMDFVGREGLQTGLAQAGQIMGGGVGPVAAGLAGAAAGLGTGIQAAARSAVSKIAPSVGAASPSLREATADIAKSAAITGATSWVIPKALQKTPQVFDYLATSRMGGGIGKPAWEYFKANVDRVMKYIGKGPEAADDVANNLRTAIGNSTQELEDLYKAGVARLSEGKSGQFKLNFQDSVFGKVQYIADDAGYLDPKRLADTEEAGFFLKRVMGRLDGLKSASPLDVYKFQKDLNAHIRDKIGSSLGIRLLQVKDVVREFIEHHPKLSPIAELNAAWHEAKLIETTAKKFTGKDDLVGFVRRVFNNQQDTLSKRNFERVSSLVPEVGEQVENLRASQSAQQLSPWFRKATGTGLETAPSVGLAAAGYLSPKALLAAPLLSPRAYALGYAYGPNMANVAASPVANAAAAGAGSIMDYYRRQGNQLPAR